MEPGRTVGRVRIGAAVPPVGVSLRPAAVPGVRRGREDSGSRTGDRAGG